MTNGVSVAIPLAFMLTAGLLLWFLAAVKVRWQYKALLTVFTIFMGYQIHQALDSYAGWPSKERMPQRAVLLNAVVREPNPSKHDPGAIFLWVVPLGLDDPDPFSYDPVSGEPRAYRIPYSRPEHEQISQAMKAMQKSGRPVLIERGGSAGGEPGDDQGNGTTYGEDEGGGFRIRDLPPPSLPEKH